MHAILATAGDVVARPQSEACAERDTPAIPCLVCGWPNVVVCCQVKRHTVGVHDRAVTEYLVVLNKSGQYLKAGRIG